MRNQTRTIIDGINPGAGWKFAGPTGLAGASLTSLIAPAARINPLTAPSHTDEFVVNVVKLARHSVYLFLRRTDLNQLYTGSNRGLGNKSGIPHIKIKYDTRRFKSCQEAKGFIAGVNRSVTRVAYTRTFDDSTLKVGPSPTGTGFLATMEATFRFDTGRTEIEFPRMLWTMGCEKEREALRLYYVNLMVHELGHIEIAGQILRHAQVQFKGSGATERMAEAAVRTKINDYWNAMVSRYVDLSDIYDSLDVSNHGTLQPHAHKHSYSANVPSGAAGAKTNAEYPFPGGDDVHLECPKC